MERLPALGLARTVVAIVFLAALVGVAVLAIAPRTTLPGGRTATTTPFADTAPPATPTPFIPGTEPPITSATPSPEPDGTAIAYENPDGVHADEYPPDGYPFVEEARSLPNFAGIWVDRNQRDFHIAVTDDIEGTFAALEDGIPRGITVYFHLHRYSYAQLEELQDAIFGDRDELLAKGIALTSGSIRETEGRVHIGMSPLTPETLAYVQDRYSGPIDYEASGVSALRPFDPPQHDEVRLIGVTEDDAGLLTCGRRPFPEATLQAAPVDVSERGPDLAALREGFDIYTDVYGELSGLTWLLAEKDEYGATFLAQRRGTWLEAPVFAGTEGWVPGTIDYCTPRPFDPEAHGSATWSLDPSFPAPTGTATELHVLVTEEECSSGSSPAGRIVPPVLRYELQRLTLAVRVRGVGGLAGCPGNPSLPVTIVLPEPLGDRELAGAAPTPR
jgi:hypothetical protein